MVLSGVSVVTATWNEKENITELVSAIRNALQDVQHELIVVDDNSTDGTLQIARRLADVAVTNERKGQSRGLLYGMRLAKYPIIITIDADLENNPEYIPQLVEQIAEFDIVVASRVKLPRVFEEIASKTLGTLVGVNDVFSNFRAYKKETISNFILRGGETFGAEFLIIAKKNMLSIGETKYDQLLRRKNPRIGGKIKSNLRIILVLIKSLIIYLT